jgi:hypothetical protein
LLYHVNEFTFDLPQMLKDKSINVFSLSDSEPSDFSLVVTRGPLAEGENITSFTNRQLQHFAKTMPGFELVRQSDTSVSKTAPATFLDFKWTSQGNPVHQWQVAFPAREKAHERDLVVMVTGTCRGQFTAEWAAMFESAVSSIELRP